MQACKDVTSRSQGESKLFLQPKCYERNLNISLTGPVEFDGVLSTKQKRNKWEEIVANTVIIPELEVRNLF